MSIYVLTKKGACLGVAVALTAASALASTVSVKNDYPEDLEIIIEPGEGTVLPSSNQIKQIVKQGQEAKIEVRKEAMGGVETFSVKGKATIPSMHNSVGPLMINQDYRIVFNKTGTGGVTGVAQPVGRAH